MKRTDQQNRALHLYFRHVADVLNDAGLTVQETLRNRMEINWNEARVKELIWRQAQEKLLGKSSTTELEKSEIDEVYDTVNRWLASMGIESVQFPHDPTRYVENFGAPEDWNDTMKKDEENSTS